SSVPSSATTPRLCTWADTPARTTTPMSDRAGNYHRPSDGRDAARTHVRQASLRPSVSHSHAKRVAPCLLDRSTDCSTILPDQVRSELDRRAISAWLTPAPSYHASRRKRDPRTG